MADIEPKLLLSQSKEEESIFREKMHKVLASEPASTADAEPETGKFIDQELILLCQQGDRESFRLLYRRYQPKVRSTLFQLCGGAVLDDMVQEVFLKAWKGLPKLRNPQYFSTWLYRISWNVATDQRRRLAQAKEKTGLGSGENKLVETAQLNSRHISSDTPDLMRLHYQDLVQRGLNSLGLEHRAVLVLHDLEDLPQKQVADILNVPVGTVKSRLFHARNSLKKFLQRQGVSL